MRYFTLTVLCATLLLTSSQCDKSDPPNGNLNLTVTYPEAVVENGSISWIQVPANGAEARLYDKDAICKGYKDAMLDIVWIGDDYTTSKYMLVSNEEGKVVFDYIPAGEYFLIVYAGQLYKYTEKYIEVVGGDTLMLAKDFTASLTFFKDLEPWDYEMPTN